MNKGNFSNSDFNGSNQIPDFTASIIIAVLDAVFWHIRTLNYIPEPEDIRNIVETYSEKFGALEELKDKLIDFLLTLDLSSLLRKNAIRFTGEKQEKKEYEVFMTGELRYMTKKQVEELESNKSDYLAWVWVDDEKSEIIIDNKKGVINPDTKEYEFLCAILKRVGKDLLHDTIMEEVKIQGNIHQYLAKLKEKTGHILDDFIKGTRWRFTIYPFKSCLITKKRKG